MNDSQSSLLEARMSLRYMNADCWIDRYASGTLRKNKRLGFAWQHQYLEERTAWEFGWEFEILPKSRLTTGVPYTEGDCHSITEVGWHADRYLACQLFEKDKYTVKYIIVEYADGRKKEGLGILVEETDAPFVPVGQIVFCIIAEYCPIKKDWEDAKNPF